MEEDSDSFDDLVMDFVIVLFLYEGSSEIVMEVLVGYFYWFLSYFFISKSVMCSLFVYGYCNVLLKGNNLSFLYD